VKIELSAEQEFLLGILATARGTTVDGMALAILTSGIDDKLTDEVIELAHTKDRDRVERFRKRRRDLGIAINRQLVPGAEEALSHSYEN
jgi:hypothetical protein